MDDLRLNSMYWYFVVACWVLVLLASSSSIRGCWRTLAALRDRAMADRRSEIAGAPPRAPRRPALDRGARRSARLGAHRAGQLHARPPPPAGWGAPSSSTSCRSVTLADRPRRRRRSPGGRWHREPAGSTRDRETPEDSRAPLHGDRRLLALPRLRAGDPGHRGPSPAAAGVRLMALLLLFHAGHHLDAGTVLSWWTWEPVHRSLLLALSGALYAAGLVRLWRRAGVGQGIRRWEAVCFAAGWLALIVALLSPVDALGGILFSAHMAQHELLILVAAPLMVLGRPLAPFLWALPGAGAGDGRPVVAGAGLRRRLAPAHRAARRLRAPRPGALDLAPAEPLPGDARRRFHPRPPAPELLPQLRPLLVVADPRPLRAAGLRRRRALRLPHLAAQRRPRGAADLRPAPLVSDLRGADEPLGALAARRPAARRPHHVDPRRRALHRPRARRCSRPGWARRNGGWPTRGAKRCCGRPSEDEQPHDDRTAETSCAPSSRRERSPASAGRRLRPMPRPQARRVSLGLLLDPDTPEGRGAASASTRRGASGELLHVEIASGPTSDFALIGLAAAERRRRRCSWPRLRRQRRRRRPGT